jgi:hypothetical protein
MDGLIVGDNRLFMKSWVHRGHAQTDHPSDGWSYEISEVQLEDRTHRKVFEMTAAVVEQVFQVSYISSCTKIRLHAIGFGKSIFLLCKQSGISILYDLSTSLWELLPANPWVPRQGTGDQLMWHGNHPMNLIMPQWDRQHGTVSVGIQTSV